MVPPRPFTCLGQYDLIRPIGSGGMGVVYEARHRTLGRRVAVKVLHAREAASPLQVSRFLGEGRAAAQVRHAHVVDVYDFGVDDGVPFLVMELVLGETLAQRLERQHRLSLEATAELLLPVVSAVAELHAAGIVHRDLKPANILLARDRSGETAPKVADFGVSRMSGSAAELTDSKVVLGTYAYMAPEQGRCSREATEQSDQYALGAILYECATGRKPFDGKSPYELLHAIMSGTLAPPSAHVPALPPAFDAMVMRALCREPLGRFSCAEELGEALLAFAEPRIAARWADEFRASRSADGSQSVPPVTSSRSMRAAARYRPGPSRRTALVVAALLGTLVVASGLSVLVSRPSPQPATTALQPPSDPGVVQTSSEAPAAIPSEPAVATAPTTAMPLPSPPLPRAMARPRPIVVPAPTTRPPSAASGDNGAPILDPR